jgi:hypothetical protein
VAKSARFPKLCAEYNLEYKQHSSVQSNQRSPLNSFFIFTKITISDGILPKVMLLIHSGSPRAGLSISIPIKALARVP